MVVVKRRWMGRCECRREEEGARLYSGRTGHDSDDVDGGRARTSIWRVIDSFPQRHPVESTVYFQTGASHFRLLVVHRRVVASLLTYHTPHNDRHSNCLLCSRQPRAPTHVYAPNGLGTHIARAWHDMEPQYEGKVYSGDVYLSRDEEAEKERTLRARTQT